jgi:AcrR family transcriptional regulator
MTTKNKKTRDLSDDEFFEAYINLSYSSGLENITLQKIADETGVAIGTVRYRFRGKGLEAGDEAVKYVITKAYSFMETFVFEERRKKGFHPLKAYCSSMFSWIDKYPQHAALLLWYYHQCATESPVALPNSVLIDRALVRIESLINECYGLGIYKKRNSIDKNLSQKIQSIVLGFCLAALTQDSKKKTSFFDKLSFEVVDTLMKHG